MRLLRPFAAFLPQADLAPEVAMPPVAAVTTDQWQRLTDEKPNSFLHVMRSAIDSSSGGQPPHSALPSGRARFDAMVEAGVFHRVEPATYYVYRLHGNGTSRTGVVAEVATRGVIDGGVLPHEATRRETEDLIAAHLAEVRLNANPVALTYRGETAVDEIVAKIATSEPLIDFVADDGVEQSIWVADRSLATLLDDALAAVTTCYITDGHHRVAASVRLAGAGREAGSHFIGVLFPDDQVRVLEYNRCVTDLGGLTPDELLRRLAELTFLEEVRVGGVEEARPTRKGEVGMALKGRWFRITLPDRLGDDPVAALDVSRLQEAVLGPLLGIDDPRTDHRLAYVPGPAGLGELSRRDAAVCFALYPASADEVMAVADAGLVMPPKSTWFEPKVLGGLIVGVFDEPHG